MDINTEVRHGDTARCCVLTAAVTECSLSAPPPCLRRDQSQRAAAGVKSGRNKFVGVLELDCGLCGLCGLSRLRANLCLD